MKQEQLELEENSELVLEEKGLFSVKVNKWKDGVFVVSVRDANGNLLFMKEFDRKEVD